MSTSPAKLKVDLAYYTQKEKKLLSKGVYVSVDLVKKVKEFQRQGEIALADFLNYFLIHRAENPLYATYADREKLLSKAILILEDVVTTHNTVNWQPGSGDLQKWVGESVSLSVVGSLFGLTAADWNTIPVMQISGFDFERVFTGITIGNEVIQVEAKGSFVNDNTIKQSAIYTHAKKIRTKKKNILAAGSTYSHPAAIRLGVIASIDQTGNARCFLLDPPGDELEGELHRHKIASRLEHLSFILWLLAPRAHLPRVLADRATKWRAINNQEPKGSLTHRNGYAFTPANYVETYLARGKIWLKEQDVVGQLFQIDEKQKIFIGVQGDVVRAAIKQDIYAILQQSFEPSSMTLEITSRAVKLGGNGRDVALEKSSLQLTFHRASSGVVIGVSD